MVVMNETLLQAAALIIPLIFAIVFHEIAHGWVALTLGDPTARDAHRLSLNPLRHVDPIGTLLVPGFLWLTLHMPLGWAKPVPVNKWRLREPRAGMMLVAAAGPGTNFVLAGVGALLLGLLMRPYVGVQQPAGLAGFVALNLFNFIQINVFLAMFNLLPIPPFDGSHIAEGLLPRDLARSYARLRGLGMGLVLLLLVVLPSLVPSLDIIGRFVLPPVEWLTGYYMALAQAIVGG